METKITIEHITALYRNAQDFAAFVDTLVAETAGLDRDQYLATVRDWKDQYAAKAAAIRKAKIDRKGEGNGSEQTKRQSYRYDARTLMAVRTGLKEVARRHHASRVKTMVA